MKPILPSCLLWAFCCQLSFGQFPDARLNTIYPVSIQRGQTVEVVVGGANLEGLSGLHFSGTGFTVAEVQANKAKVTSGPDVPLGLVDVRAVGAWGSSNVRRLLISDLPQVIEAEVNNLKEQAQEVPMNAMVNGRCDQRSDIDYYRFAAKAGEIISIDCFAQRIDSRMKPVLTLFGPSGKRERIITSPTGKDTSLVFTAANEGQYMVRVHDLTYEGSAEYFYALAVQNRPVVRGLYPPVVSSSQPGELTQLGADLAPLTPVSVTAPAGSLENPMLDSSVFLESNQVAIDGFTYRADPASGTPLPLLVSVTDLPVTVEVEPNTTVPQATVITAPCEVVGRIDGPDDRDFFRFTAPKGTLELTSFAERLGSPIDLVVVLRRIIPGVDGKPDTAQDVAEFDDFATNVGRTKFDTSTHDPVATLTIPADGDYVLEVGDQFGGVRGGPKAAYRIRLAAAKPDFRLAVVPVDEDSFSSLVVRQGGTTYAQVFALRQGGFAGEIRIEAANLPAGIQAAPVIMGPGVNEVPLVFKAAADCPDVTQAVEIRGTTTIGETTVTRIARPGEIIWSAAANVPKASRLVQELILTCRPNAPYHLDASPAEVTVSQGSLLSLQLKLERRWPEFTQALADVTALYLPPNIDNPKVTLADNQSEGWMHFNVKNNAPVGSFSFVVMGNAKIPFTKTPEDPKAAKNPITVASPSNPITVKIVPRLADLVATPPNPTVKVGEKIAVKVAVNRVNNFEGPVVLSLTVPAGVTGLTAEPVTVAADQKEATVEIACAADAPEGDKAFVTIRGTMMVEGQPVFVDALLTVKVTK